MNSELTATLSGLHFGGFLTTVEAASFLNLSNRTLEDWRLRGGGPAFRKLGRAVRYAVADLNAFADGSTWRTTGCALAA